MTTENKNILSRCGTRAELIQPNQLQPGQVGVCTDRPSLLYRRRENASERPSEIDEYVCTDLSKQPDTDRTGGIAVTQIPTEPTGTMKVVNMWFGQVLANAGDHDVNGVPNHGFLDDKLTATGGIEIELIAESPDNGAPKLLRFKLASSVATTDVNVLASETDAVAGALVDKLMSSDESITMELVGGAGEPQKLNLKSTGGTSGNFLSRDGSNGFDVLTADPVRAEGKAFYRDQDETVKVVTKSSLDMLMNRQSRLMVVNRTGTPVPSGRAVYLTGWYNGYPTFSLSIANAQATSFISGVTIGAMGNDEVGEIIGFGMLPFNTTGMSPNNMLWLSDVTPGLLTTSAPAFPNFLSLVGRVCIVGDATTGLISIEKGVLPTMSNSAGGGIIDATYIGMEAFPLANIVSGSNAFFGGNHQLWTAVISRFDTQINRLSALLVAEYEYVDTEHTRFGITDVNGNLLGQTERLGYTNGTPEESYATMPTTRGIKTLPVEANGVINIAKNTLYFFTLASNKNASSWGIGTGYQSNEISSGVFAKLALYSGNSGIATDGRIPQVANGASSHSSRIWMIGSKS